MSDFDPIEAGKAYIKELAKVEGGAYSCSELYAMADKTLSNTVFSHRSVSFISEDNQRFYPKWQFTKDGNLINGIEEILVIFNSDDKWRVMRYFLGNRNQLGSKRPLDLLRDGKIAEVIEHAKRHAEENTW